MTPKAREELLEFARLAADWYCNNQNTDERPWGGVRNSADTGRFIYEYYPATGVCRGGGVWGQPVAIMGLLPLAERLGHPPYRDAALAAAKYLLTLQILDSRDERLFGAFGEHTPQSNYSYPRDGATALMGLCVLYRETEDEEYLYRAGLFADWYIKNAMDEKGWPCYTYHFDKRGAEWRDPKIWQAGAGLGFYQLAKLTGEKRYLDQGLRPLMDGLLRIYSESEELDDTGQDDFAGIAAMAGWLALDDSRLLDLARGRVGVVLSQQDGDGSSPGFAGTFVVGLTLLNFRDLVEAKGLDDDTAPLQAAADRAASFAPSVQERSPQDLRAYGGLYGQSSYSVSRAQIHNRSIGYSLIFMLRYEGGVEVPGYNVMAWVP